MSQFSIPCSVYRGGTSRGIFFHEKDLPQDLEERKHIFLNGIDAYNPSQIDGLGSGTSHTSKIVVISPSMQDDIDVDYTFYQVGIGEPIVDSVGTCGNLMSAVGAFAVDEGLVDVSPSDEYCSVSVYNTNIQKRLQIQVPVVHSEAKVSGDYSMPGVVKPGARFSVDILHPGGGSTGQTMPLQAVYRVKTRNGDYSASLIDVVNPLIFLSAEAFGLKGTELISELSANRELLQEMEAIRCEMAVAAGMASTVEQATQEVQNVPKIGLVAEPQDYVTTSGRRISKEEVDIVAKMISMRRFHRTFAASALFSLAAAALLPGTIPNQCTKDLAGPQRTIRIGHPEGVAEVRVSLTEHAEDVASVGLDRTVRRIIKGDLFILPS